MGVTNSKETGHVERYDTRQSAMALLNDGFSVAPDDAHLVPPTAHDMKSGADSAVTIEIGGDDGDDDAHKASNSNLSAHTISVQHARRDGESAVRVGDGGEAHHNGDFASVYTTKRRPHEYDEDEDDDGGGGDISIDIEAESGNGYGEGATTGVTDETFFSETARAIQDMLEPQLVPVDDWGLDAGPTSDDDDDNNNDDGYGNDLAAMYDEARERQRKKWRVNDVVCVKINDAYAEVQKPSDRDMSELVDRMQDMGVDVVRLGDDSSGGGDDDDDDDARSAVHGDTAGEATATDEEGAFLLHDSLRPSTFFPFAPLHKTQVLRLTNKVYTSTRSDVVSVAHETRELFAKLAYRSLRTNDPSHIISTRHAQKLSDDMEARNESFTAVSADTFFAVLIMARRQRKAMRRLRAFVDECSSDNNEFRGKYVREKLEEIGALLVADNAEVAINDDDDDDGDDEQDACAEKTHSASADERTDTPSSSAEFQVFEEDRNAPPSSLLPKPMSNGLLLGGGAKNGHVDTWPPASPVPRPPEPTRELGGV